MQDNNLVSINQALTSENGSLKGIVEQLVAEKQALEQTVMEILKANIALKAGCSLLEKRVAAQMAESVQKDEQIKALQPIVTEHPIEDLAAE